MNLKYRLDSMADESNENEGRYPSGDISDVVRFTDTYSMGDDGDFVKESHIEIDGPLDEIETIHSHLVEELENARSRDGHLDNVTILSQRERVLLLEFFTITHAVIEDYSTRLLENELLKEEHQSEDYSNQLFQRHLTQGQREELMWEVGIIEGGLKGELKQVRQARNQLVHDRGERMALSSIEEWKANSDRGVRAVRKLRDLYLHGEIQ